MPKTKIQSNLPDYHRWRARIRGLMAENGITTRTAGHASNASYSRWLSEPWRFSVGNLAEFMKNLHLSNEEEEELLLTLWREVRKR